MLSMVVVTVVGLSGPSRTLVDHCTAKARLVMLDRAHELEKHLSRRLQPAISKSRKLLLMQCQQVNCQADLEQVASWLSQCF